MFVHRHAANIILPAISNTIWSLPQPQPTVYLTFDDGPEPAVTEEVLKILADFNAPATFFMQGSQIKKYQDELITLDYRPHQIANHGFSHTPLILKSKQFIREEINRTETYLNRCFNRRIHLFRPPYGLWGSALHRHVVEKNMGLVLWSLMANDFKLSAADTVQLVKSNWKNGDIIVFHDSQQCSGTILKALPQILKYFTDNHVQIKLIGD